MWAGCKRSIVEGVPFDVDLHPRLGGVFTVHPGVPGVWWASAFWAFSTPSGGAAASDPPGPLPEGSSLHPTNNRNFSSNPIAEKTFKCEFGHPSLLHTFLTNNNDADETPQG